MPPVAAAAALPQEQLPANLSALVDTFKADVAKLLLPVADRRTIVLASAWLVSDNVMVDLLHRHFPQLLKEITIGAVDTLHLFNETHELVGAMKAKYGIKPIVNKPAKCETIDHFNQVYGAADKLTDADFDSYSKIQPLTRVFEEVGKQVLITGRRCDQGNARVELPVWEEGKKCANLVASWSWADIVAYVDHFDVPYNRKHHVIYRATTPVKAVTRHLPDARWEATVLDRPYWRLSAKELQGDKGYVYVWKSFGDVHTSVPVEAHESERAGRFVGRSQTECGIHTRIALTKSAHGGGELVDRLVSAERADALRAQAAGKRVSLTERQACDFELLANGGFSPLTGYMTEAEYTSVVQHTRLPEGQLFGLPVVLDSTREWAVGDFVLLDSDTYGELGVLEVTSCYRPDKDTEALKVYGTSATTHPSVMHIKDERGEFYVGGPVHAFKLPQRDWVKCLTPREVRAQISKDDDVPLVAFQCRNPIHRAHVELFRAVQRKIPGARVMVHPVVGPTKSDDFSAKVRVKTYVALNKLLSETGIHFQYLPYNMMVGGPRECLQHMIVRKNYGCTHMIVGRDHAGCKDTVTKEDFYGPYDAQELVEKMQAELNMKAVRFMAQVYVPSLQRYMAAPEAKEKGLETATISGTKFREMVRRGEQVGEWYAFPEVVNILSQYYSSTATLTP